MATSRNIQYIGSDGSDVVFFVEKYKDAWTNIQPSFFEMTIALSFWYFAKEKVDIAVIELS